MRLRVPFAKGEPHSSVSLSKELTADREGREAKENCMIVKT